MIYLRTKEEGLWIILDYCQDKNGFVQIGTFILLGIVRCCTSDEIDSACEKLTRKLVKDPFGQISW